MKRKVLFIIVLYFILNESMELNEISNVTPTTCLDGSDCNETYTTSDTYDESTTMESENTSFGITLESNYTDNNSNRNIIDNSTINSINDPSIIKLFPRTAIYNKTLKSQTVHKEYSEICDCDLQISACDINCCCDPDCKEHQITAFSYCKDFHPELYDSRYCYSRNFIQRNNTPFILEKLADNLFCISHDNLPPTYTTNNNLELKDYKSLRENIKPTRLVWDMKSSHSSSSYNISDFYEDGIMIWILRNGYLDHLELLETSFTGLCSSKKNLKYLQNWKGSCMQRNLDNSNIHLFPEAYSNFSIIASPSLLNNSFLLSKEDCPKNVCLSITNYFCNNSWNDCLQTNKLKGNCTKGVCQNIIKSVKYIITHNGTMGIMNVSSYYIMKNISTDFYQHFEVIYNWVDTETNENFERSGNPGYIHGKPIIFGTLIKNKTNNIEIQYINYNRSDIFLSLPKALKGGECGNASERYTAKFGENIKLKCSLILKTSNFSSETCMKIRNETLRLWMKDSLFNITNGNEYKIFISKYGNITDNSTSSAVQILLDKIPEHVIMSQSVNNRIFCLGMITFLHINVLYSVLPKPKSLTNYNILGLGITFADESDLSWPKCNGKNCTDILKLDLVSYISFHEISSPSKYYFVGGPHLDISLPYDFFYPFMSSSVVTSPSILLVAITILNIINI